MNIKFSYLILLAMVVSAVSCKKDNYKEPTSFIKGRLTYNGDSVGVQFNQVPFQLYQSGYRSSTVINGTFNDEGSYSVNTFDGSYRFTIAPNQGPFRWKELANGARDTIKFDLAGEKTMNIEVTPYYMVRQLKTSISGATRVVTANFDIEKVITDATLAKGIDRVYIQVNKTNHVSTAAGEFLNPIVGGQPVGSVTGASLASLNNVTMSVTVPSIVPTQNYVYVRIGIKITGVDDLYFSPVRKLTF